jgi:phosphatidylserine/phosphatidylglycerophosphate/cardiolipin synthase-like enzyme
VDFVRDIGLRRVGLVAGRGHYEAVIRAVREARTSVWIATANLKELMVEDPYARPGRRRGRAAYRSVLEDFSELAAREVEIRILHASLPSGPFRERFDALPALVEGGVELRTCPRVHLKVVIVDGAFLYLGSANWTGAGLGAKGTGRRNFELGVVSDDEELIDEVQALFEDLWRGRECGRCRLRDECEMPLDAVDESGITVLDTSAEGELHVFRVSPKPSTT